MKKTLLLSAAFSMATMAMAAYPSASKIAGDYTFKAGEFTLNEGVVDEFPDKFAYQGHGDIDLNLFFTPEFDFTIAVDRTGQMTVTDFFFKGSMIGSSFSTYNFASYDESTGVLTLSNFTFCIPPQIGVLLGIAPADGGWKGISALTANKLTFNVAEDGTISIGDFDVVLYKASEVLATVASFQDISVSDANSQGGGGGGNNDDDNTTQYEFFQGTWSAEEYSYVSQSEVENDEGNTPTYNATVKGRTVTFKDSGSDNYNLVARVIDDTTLEFSYQAVGTIGTTFTSYQCPFTSGINENNYNDLTTIDRNATLLATYDPEKKTLTFPEGSGFRFAFIAANGYVSHVEEAFTFTAPMQWSAFKPQIILNSVRASEGEDASMNITLNFNTQWFDESGTYNYIIRLAEHFTDPSAGVDIPDVITEIEATVNGGTATGTLPGLSKGLHSFGASLLAYDADGNLYSSSKEKSVQVDIQGSSNDDDTSGIEAIANDEATGAVYDISGRIVLKNATARDLKQLAPGLYIVNGKKILK